MPKFDGSGPSGKGPMTGRGGGYCVIQLNTTEAEIDFLKNQEQALKKQLRHIKIRIRRIEKNANTKEVAG
jgi:predicted phage tail protein